MNSPTIYTRAELDRMARLAVRDFKRKLPACVRATVELDGWTLMIHDNGPTLAAYFRDEAGRHQINIAI